MTEDRIEGEELGEDDHVDAPSRSAPVLQIVISFTSSTPLATFVENLSTIKTNLGVAESYSILGLFEDDAPGGGDGLRIPLRGTWQAGDEKPESVGLLVIKKA